MARRIKASDNQLFCATSIELDTLQFDLHHALGGLGQIMACVCMRHACYGLCSRFACSLASSDRAHVVSRASMRARVVCMCYVCVFVCAA